MMTRSNELLPEGLEDRLPDASASITAVMRACLGVLNGHGYDRVRPPLLEFEDTLAARMEGLSTRNMFRFVDPASLRTLALRSDITPQIGRIAATSMAAAPRPLRLSYCGDIAIVSANQLDPARERLQLGGELIGSDSVAAVGEIVAVAVEALHAAGLTGVSVDFTLPDLIDVLTCGDTTYTPEQIAAIRRELDNKDAGGLKDAGGEAFLPLLYATGPLSDAIEQLKAFDSAGVLTQRLEGLEQIAARLAELAGDDIRLTLDPTERHGFEYQSAYGFTLYGRDLRGAAGRGGTYRIGGSAEVATGFTLYADRIAASIAVPQSSRLIYLPEGHDPRQATTLRGEGARTIAQLGDGEDPRDLGCTHVLQGADVKEL